MYIPSCGFLSPFFPNPPLVVCTTSELLRAPQAEVLVGAAEDLALLAEGTPMHLEERYPRKVEAGVAGPIILFVVINLANVRFKHNKI